MTHRTKTLAPRARSSEQRSLLAYLTARRESGSRLIRRGSSDLDPTNLEILDAIHRRAK
jgi:hypothetical protein